MRSPHATQACFGKQSNIVAQHGTRLGGVTDARTRGHNSRHLASLWAQVLPDPRPSCAPLRGGGGDRVFRQAPASSTRPRHADLAAGARRLLSDPAPDYRRFVPAHREVDWRRPPQLPAALRIFGPEDCQVVVGQGSSPVRHWDAGGGHSWLQRVVVPPNPHCAADIIRCGITCPSRQCQGQLPAGGTRRRGRPAELGQSDNISGM